MVSVPGGVQIPPALSPGLAGAPGSLCWVWGWLWVAAEHPRDVGSSQGQEAAAEKTLLAKLPHFTQHLAEKLSLG